MSDDEQNIFTLPAKQNRHKHLTFAQRIDELDINATLSAEVSTPEFLAVLTKDNKKQMTPLLPKVLGAPVKRIQDHSSEPEQLEKIFTNMAFILRLFASVIGDDLKHYLQVLLPLFTHSHEYIRSFTAEAVAYLFKRIKTTEIKPRLDDIASFLIEQPSHTLIDSIGAILFECVKSIENSFSIARLTILFDWILMDGNMASECVRDAFFDSLVRMRHHCTTADEKGAEQLMAILLPAYENAAVSVSKSCKPLNFKDSSANSTFPTIVSSKSGEYTRLVFLTEVFSMWINRSPRITGNFDMTVFRVMRVLEILLCYNLSTELLMYVIRGVATLWRAVPQSVTSYFEKRKDKTTWFENFTWPHKSYETYYKSSLKMEIPSGDARISVFDLLRLHGYSCPATKHYLTPTISKEGSNATCCKCSVVLSGFNSLFYPTIVPGLGDKIDQVFDFVCFMTMRNIVTALNDNTVDLEGEEQIVDLIVSSAGFCINLLNQSDMCLTLSDSPSTQSWGNLPSISSVPALLQEYYKRIHQTASSQGETEKKSASNDKARSALLALSQKQTQQKKKGVESKDLSKAVSAVVASSSKISCNTKTEKIILTLLAFLDKISHFSTTQHNSTSKNIYTVLHFLQHLTQRISNFESSDNVRTLTEVIREHIWKTGLLMFQKLKETELMHEDDTTDSIEEQVFSACIGITNNCNVFNILREGNEKASSIQNMKEEVLMVIDALFARRTHRLPLCLLKCLYELFNQCISHKELMSEITTSKLFDNTILVLLSACADKSNEIRVYSIKTLYLLYPLINSIGISVQFSETLPLENHVMQIYNSIVISENTCKPQESANSIFEYLISLDELGNGLETERTKQDTIRRICNLIVTDYKNATDGSTSNKQMTLSLDVATALTVMVSQMFVRFSPLWRTVYECLSVMLLPLEAPVPEKIASATSGTHIKKVNPLKKGKQNAEQTSANLGSGIEVPAIDRFLLVLVLSALEGTVLNMRSTDPSITDVRVNKKKVSQMISINRKKKITKRNIALIGKNHGEFSETQYEDFENNASNWCNKVGGFDPCNMVKTSLSELWKSTVEKSNSDSLECNAVHRNMTNLYLLLGTHWAHQVTNFSTISQELTPQAESYISQTIQYGFGNIYMLIASIVEFWSDKSLLNKSGSFEKYRNIVKTMSYDDGHSQVEIVRCLGNSTSVSLSSRLFDLLNVMVSFGSFKKSAAMYGERSSTGEVVETTTQSNCISLQVRITELIATVILPIPDYALQRLCLKFLNMSKLQGKLGRYNSLLENLVGDSGNLKDTLLSVKFSETFLPQDRQIVIPIVLRLMLSKIMRRSQGNSAGVILSGRSSVYNALSELSETDIASLLAIMLNSLISIKKKNESGQYDAMGAFESYDALCALLHSVRIKMMSHFEISATEADLILSHNNRSINWRVNEEKTGAFAWYSECMNYQAQLRFSSDLSDKNLVQEKLVLGVLLSLGDLIKQMESRLAVYSEFLMQIFVSIYSQGSSKFQMAKNSKLVSDEQADLEDEKDDNEEDLEQAEAALESMNQVGNLFDTHGKIGSSFRSLIRFSTQRICDLITKFPTHPSWVNCLSPINKLFTDSLRASVNAGADSSCTTLLLAISANPATFSLFDRAFPEALGILFNVGCSPTVLSRLNKNQAPGKIVDIALDIALRLVRGGDNSEADIQRAMKKSRDGVKLLSQKEKRKMIKRRDMENSHSEGSEDENMVAKEDSIVDELIVNPDGEVLNSVFHDAPESSQSHLASTLCENEVDEVMMSRQLMMEKTITDHDLHQDWRHAKNNTEAVKILRIHRAAGLRIIKSYIDTFLNSLQVLIPLRRSTTNVEESTNYLKKQKKKHSKNKAFISIKELEFLSIAIVFSDSSQVCCQLSSLLLNSLPSPALAGRIMAEGPIKRMRLTLESLRHLIEPLATTFNRDSSSRDVIESALRAQQSYMSKLLPTLKDTTSREMICECMLAIEVSLVGVSQPISFVQSISRTAHSKEWLLLVQEGKRGSSLEKWLIKNQLSFDSISSEKKWHIASHHILLSLNVLKPSANFDPDVDTHMEMLATLADLHLFESSGESLSLNVTEGDNVDEDEDMGSFIDTNRKKKTSSDKKVIIPPEYLVPLFRHFLYLLLSPDVDISVRRASVVCIHTLIDRFSSIVNNILISADKKIDYSDYKQVFSLIFNLLLPALRQGLHTDNDESMRAILQTYSSAIRGLSSKVVDLAKINKAIKLSTISHADAPVSEDEREDDDLESEDEEGKNNAVSLDNQNIEQAAEWMKNLLHAELIDLLRLGKVFEEKLSAAGTIGGDLFGDLLHLQRHRRARAFTALSQACRSKKLSESTCNFFNIPLCIWAIIQRGSSKDSYDVGLSDRAIECLSATTSHSSWNAAVKTVRLLASLIKKHSAREKVLIKAICTTVASFDTHLSECTDAVKAALASIQENTVVETDADNAEDRNAIKEAVHAERIASLVREQTAPNLYGNDDDGNASDEELETTRVVKKSKNDKEQMEQQLKNAAEEISLRQKTLCTKILPILRSLLLDKKKSASSSVTQEGKGKAHQGSEESGTVRPAVSAIILRVLRCLPPTRFHGELPRLFARLVASVKSRDGSQRDAARKAICDVAIALGPSYLSWLIAELSSQLTRGFLQSVLVYTVHNVLFCLTKGDIAMRTKKMDSTGKKLFLTPGTIDASIPHILPIVISELERQLDADRPDIDFKEVGAAKSGVREAKAVRGPALLRIVAEYSSAGECMSGLLTFLYGLLVGTAYDRDAQGARSISNAYSPKYLRRIRELLNQATLGFASNHSLTAASRTHLSLRLISLSSHLMNRNTIAQRHRAARQLRQEVSDRNNGKIHTGSYWVTKMDEKKKYKSVEDIENEELNFLQRLENMEAQPVTEVVPSVSNAVGGDHLGNDAILNLLPIHAGGSSSSIPRAKVVKAFVNTELKKKEQQRLQEESIKKAEKAKGEENEEYIEDITDEARLQVIKQRDMKMELQPGAAAGKRAELVSGPKGKFDPRTRAITVGVCGIKLFLVCLRRHKVPISRVCRMMNEKKSDSVTEDEAKNITTAAAVELEREKLAQALELIISPLVFAFCSNEPELLSSSSKCILQLISYNNPSIFLHVKKIAMTILKVYEVAGKPTGFNNHSLEAESIPACTRILASLLSKEESTSDWFASLLTAGENSKDEDDLEIKESDDALTRWRKRKAQEAKKMMMAYQKDKTLNDLSGLAFTQALLGQIHMSLEDHRLAPSSIMLFKKVILVHQKKSILPEDDDVMKLTTDCADKLADILVQSESSKISLLAARCFVDYILFFPMNMKQQKRRIGFLINNLSYHTATGRIAILHAINMFINNITVESLNKDYGATFVLAIGARLGVEGDEMVRKLCFSLLVSILKLLCNTTALQNADDHMEKLFTVSTSWAFHEKEYLRAAFVSICSSFIVSWKNSKRKMQTMLYHAISSILLSCDMITMTKAQYELIAKALPPLDIFSLRSKQVTNMRLHVSIYNLMNNLIHSLDVPILENMLKKADNNTNYLANSDVLEKTTISFHDTICMLWKFMLSHGITSDNESVRMAATSTLTSYIMNALQNADSTTEHKKGSSLAVELSLLRLPLPLASITFIGEENDYERTLQRASAPQVNQYTKLLSYCCNAYGSEFLESQPTSIPSLANLMTSLMKLAYSPLSEKYSLFAPLEESGDKEGVSNEDVLEEEVEDGEESDIDESDNSEAEECSDEDVNMEKTMEEKKELLETTIAEDDPISNAFEEENDISFDVNDNGEEANNQLEKEIAEDFSKQSEEIDSALIAKIYSKSDVLDTIEETITPKIPNRTLVEVARITKNMNPSIVYEESAPLAIQWISKKLLGVTCKILSDVITNVVRLSSVLDMIMKMMDEIPVESFIHPSVLASMIEIGFRCESLKSPYSIDTSLTPLEIKLLSSGKKMAFVREKGKLLMQAIEGKCKEYNGNCLTAFTKCLNAVRLKVTGIRMQRKIKEKQLFVKNPSAAYAKKRRRNEKKVVSRKRTKRN